MSKAAQAKSIATKLSKLSRQKGVSYQSIATSFLLERLLARLIFNQDLAKCLVFKGGYVGLRVYNSARYTIDLDALLVKAEVATTMKQTTLAIESDIDDGTWFVLDSQIDLKTQGEYGGIRQIFRAGIGEQPRDIRRSQVINFDLGIGDPVTPGPVKMKTSELIGDGDLSWQVYPIETILAEKLQTLIERGADNSRAKDVFDLFFYISKADAETLKEAVNRCFDFRGTTLPDDPVRFLSKIDKSLLSQGWKGATASLKDAPTFDEAFNGFLIGLHKIFPSKRDQE